jgi:hypothetical protein
MKIVGQLGHYQCGYCGDPLRFEQIKLSESTPFAVGYCPRTATYSNATGELLVKACPRAEIKLKVPLNILDCEQA